MKFFEQQHKAKRKTKILLLYFLLGVVGTIALVYLAVMFLMGYAFKAKHFGWWNPEVFFYVFFLTTLIILIASIQKLIELSNGGKTIAIALGGEKLINGMDFEEKRLLNVVSEMAIASGLPVPEIYILRGEHGINAFAAGNSPSDAVIGVTEGLLRHLNRDELQGVIAHEFSHILNGDMRLNIRLIAAIAGILAISQIGYIILRVRTKGKGGGQIKLFGLALLIIGSCGALFARIIQSAISRQREYLADAAAVQFTRNPGGIAGALKKILSIHHGSTVENANASEVAHMFFSSGFSSILSSLFATHPPIEQRIKAIEDMAPGFIDYSSQSFQSQPEQQLVSSTSTKSRPPILVSNFLSSAGTLTNSSANYYNDMLSSLNPEIIKALHDVFGSTVLVYTMLLSEDNQIRNKQIAEISRIVSVQMICEIMKLHPIVRKVPRIKKLPIAHIAIHQLKSMSKNQFDEFEKTVDSLIQCDNSIDLFEFALSKIIKRSLVPQYRRDSKLAIVKPLTLDSFESIKKDCVVLLSALAWCGHDTQETAEKAFALGSQILGIDGEDVALTPYDKCDLTSINRALDNCLRLEPLLREKMINACAVVVSEDNVLTAYEAELLRAIADSLECPIPPVLFE